MTKPTLVQSILNKPSQTYTQLHSQKKDYYSNRQEMLRIAAEANVGASSASASAPSSSSTSLVSTLHRQSSTKSPESSSLSLEIQSSKSNKLAMEKSKALPPQPTAQSRTSSSTTKTSSSSSSSPRVAATRSTPTNSHPPRSNSHVSSTRGHSSPKAIPLHARQLSYTDDEDDDSSESDSDLDIFFTPNQSPRTSMASSLNFPGGRKPSRRSLTSAGAEMQTMKVPSSPLSALPMALAAMVEEQVKLNGSMFVDHPRPPSPPTPKAGRSSRLPSTNTVSAVTALSNATSNAARTSKANSTAPASSAPTSRTSNRGTNNSDSSTPSTINPTSKSSTTVTRTYHTLSSLSISSTSFDGNSLLSDITQSPNTTLATTPGGNTSTSEDRSKSRIPGTAKHISSTARSGNTGETKRKLPPSELSKEGTKSVRQTESMTSNSKGKGKETVNDSKVNNLHLGATKSSTEVNPNKTTSVPPANNTDNPPSYKPPKQPHTFSAFTRSAATPEKKTDSSKESLTALSTTKSSSASSPPTFGMDSPARVSKPYVSNGQTTAQSTPPPDADPPKYSPSSTSTNSTPSPARRPPPSSVKLAHSIPYIPPPPPSNTRLKPPGPIGPIMTGIGSGMAALMEEDEDGPLTPLMERADEEWGWETPYKATSKTLRHTSPRASQKMNMNGHGRPDQVHRNGSIDSSSTLSLLSVSSSSTERSRGQSSSMSTDFSQPRTLAAEVSALKNSQMPAGTLPSKGTQGFNSLILPRAPPPINSKSSGMGAGLNVRLSAKGDGHVDLMKSGVAKTTMATVEVVRGLGNIRNGALAKIGNVFGALGRRRTASGGRGGSNGAIPVPVEGFQSRDSSMLRDINAGSTVLGFTSYRPPPDYVPSNSVLVQVWAVGVDGVDGRLVGVQFGLPNAAMYDAQEAATVLAEAEGILHAHDGQFHEEPLDLEGDINMDNDPQLSTSSNSTPNKKGAFSGLGRSFSLKAKMGLGRSASSKKKGGSVGNGASNGHAIQNGNGSQNSSPSGKSGDMNRSNSTPAAASQIPKRSGSFSLKRNNTTMTTASTISTSSTGDSPLGQRRRKAPIQTIPDVGYIPGRSFVGRVLEVGWEVKDEVARKGEWVVGLLDVRKCGALSEFIVVDRHRIHRVPNPQKAVVAESDLKTAVRPVWITPPTASHGITTLSLEELSLLPLCGLFAYRAVRTFAVAFSSAEDGENTQTASDRRQQREDEQLGSRMPFSQRKTTEHSHGHRRRALVLRGHDGVGAMAVQMLVQRGWKISVHVPFSSVPANAMQEDADRFMRAVEERARQWGADEIIFDDGEEGGGLDDGCSAAVRVMESLREEGDVFDAVLDTIGGKGIRMAGERLLKSTGLPGESRRHGVGQFTTIVGDKPERMIPSARDNLRAGLRTFRRGSGDASANLSHAQEAENKVGYAWVQITQDIDWEGAGIDETLGILVRMAAEDGIRPLVDDLDRASPDQSRVVPMTDTPSVFIDNGRLRDGGTVVVKVAVV